MTLSDNIEIFEDTERGYIEDYKVKEFIIELKYIFKLGNIHSTEAICCVIDKLAGDKLI